MWFEPSLVEYFFALCILLVVTVVAFLSYAGLFAKIDIKAAAPPFDRLGIAYKFCRGPYSKAGQYYTEVHSLVPHLTTVGIYYDDPDKITPQELRYAVGVVTSRGDELPSESDVAALRDNGFSFFSLPVTSYAVLATFPFTCSLSILIGITRVYPKLAKFIQEKNLCAHPMLEIYEKDHILFMAPLCRQDEFYIPEVQDERESVMTSRTEESGTVDGSIRTDPHGVDDDAATNDESSASSFEDVDVHELQ